MSACWPALADGRGGRHGSADFVLQWRHCREDCRGLRTGSQSAWAGEGGATDDNQEHNLLTFLGELNAYGKVVRHARRREFFPLEKGHPLYNAVENLGDLPIPEPLETWLELCDRSRPCGTAKGWKNRQRDILLTDIPTLRAWGEARLKECQTNPTDIPKVKQHDRSDRGGGKNDSDVDRKFMERAVEEARNSKPEDTRVHPKVGVVVVKDGRELATAFRGELDKGEHAEFTALERKLANETLAGATVYTTLEPCTTRNHPKLPCAVRLIERKVSRVVTGMLDPNPTISGKGVFKLREANIAVAFFDSDLMAKIEEMNREFIRHHKNAAEPAPASSARPSGSLGATPMRRTDAPQVAPLQAISWIETEAWAVRKLIDDYKATGRFREMLLQWGNDTNKRDEEHRVWLERRKDHFERVVQQEQRLRTSPSAAPPNEILHEPERNWVWDQYPEDRTCQLEAWVPLDLALANEPDTSLPLPLRADRVLTLAERYAVLTAIHDRRTRGIGKIDTWSDVTDATHQADRLRWIASQRYFLLQRQVDELTEQDWDAIEAIRRSVEDNLSDLELRQAGQDERQRGAGS